VRLRICASRSDSAFPAPTSTFLNHEPSRWRGRLLKCWPTSCSTWKLLKGVHSQDTPAAGSPITRGNCAHPLALQVANGNCLQADSGGCPPKAEHWCLVNCEPAGGSTDFPVRRSTAHVSYVAPQLQSLAVDTAALNLSEMSKQVANASSRVVAAVCSVALMALPHPAQLGETQMISR